MSGFLRRQAFLDRSYITPMQWRGVDWFTDRYVLVRADALRTAPKAGREAIPIPPKAWGRVMTEVRGGVGLDPQRNVIKNADGTVRSRLLYGHGRIVPLNPGVADEWLSHDWDAITQAAFPGVAFWQKRRGKLALIGVVMPMALGVGGEFTVASLDDVGAVAA